MGTGSLKITESYLAQFAQQKLAGFIQDMNSTPIRNLANFTAGSSGSSDAPAAAPDGRYSAVLPGNPVVLGSAAKVRTDFANLTAALNGHVQTLATAAQTMSQDLLLVNQVLDNSEDKNNVTAAEMAADLQNVDVSGSVSGSGAVPIGPVGSSPSGSSPGGTNSGGSNTGSGPASGSTPA
jgi:hypothetical protein